MQPHRRLSVFRSGYHPFSQRRGKLTRRLRTGCERHLLSYPGKTDPKAGRHVLHSPKRHMADRLDGMGSGKLYSEALSHSWFRQQQTPYPYAYLRLCPGKYPGFCQRAAYFSNGLWSTWGYFKESVPKSRNIRNRPGGRQHTASRLRFIPLHSHKGNASMDTGYSIPIYIENPVRQRFGGKLFRHAHLYCRAGQERHYAFSFKPQTLFPSRSAGSGLLAGRPLYRPFR